MGTLEHLTQWNIVQASNNILNVGSHIGLYPIIMDKIIGWKITHKFTSWEHLTQDKQQLSQYWTWGSYINLANIVNMKAKAF
jgi:hypothetical protein